jgi:ferredoxin
MMHAVLTSNFQILDSKERKEMRPEVDESLCIGDGICVDICPQVFEMRDDNLAHVINAAPGSELSDMVHEAADACPTSAISIHE